jgi:hypothetical protein
VPTLTKWPCVLKAIACATMLLWFPGPAGSRTEEKRRPDDPRNRADAVEIQMRKVNYRLTPDVVLEIRSLRGQLERTNPELPVSFDDSSSFSVQIDTAEVAVSAASLTALMNSYVLAYDGAPIKKVTVSIDGYRLIQKGTIHKGIDLPFEIEGSLSTTEDGNVRLHADKVSAAHVPVKGLLHLFGEDLAKLVNQNAGRGMRIDGDDIILIPKALTPAPHLAGRVARVSIENGKIIQFFDSGRRSSALAPPLPSPAYIYNRGGLLRFGKLTMNDADLEIVGDRPGAFEYSPQDYLKQLVAGYSKTTEAKGLVAHVADYSRFRQRRAATGN